MIQNLNTQDVILPAFNGELRIKQFEIRNSQFEIPSALYKNLRTNMLRLRKTDQTDSGGRLNVLPGMRKG